LVDLAGFGGEEVTQGIGGVVTACAIFVHIHFEDVFRVIGVVLESGQAIEQASATFVNEKPGSDASVRIAQSAQDFSPAVDALDIGGGEPKSVAKVLLRDGGAVGLAAENIGPG